jgi:hypothetical protein
VHNDHKAEPDKTKQEQRGVLTEETSDDGGDIHAIAAVSFLTVAFSSVAENAWIVFGQFQASLALLQAFRRIP